MRIVALPPPA